MTTKVRPNEGPEAQIAIFWIVGFPSKIDMNLKSLGPRKALHVRTFSLPVYFFSDLLATLHVSE